MRDLEIAITGRYWVMRDLEIAAAGRYNCRMLNLAKSHRSIRSFINQDIDEALLDELLYAGLRSSSAGNLQTWSVVVTRNEARKRRLYELHREQGFILQAPVLLTFCADVYRVREWLRVNESKQSFDDLLGFLTGAVDAVIAAQTISLAAESVGLGICYLGTTWWAAKEIIDYLELPRWVFPVTSISVGYPAEDPPLRDRLPLEVMVHREKYQRLSDEEIRRTHAEREKNAWERYNAYEPLREKLAAAGINKVTDFYTSEYKYPKELHERISRVLIEMLQEQGLWL